MQGEKLDKASTGRDCTRSVLIIAICGSRHVGAADRVLTCAGCAQDNVAGMSTVLGIGTQTVKLIIIGNCTRGVILEVLLDRNVTI